MSQISFAEIWLQIKIPNQQARGNSGTGKQNSDTEETLSGTRLKTEPIHTWVTPDSVMILNQNQHYNVNQYSKGSLESESTEET